LAKLGCNIIVHGRSRENCNNTLKQLGIYNVNTYVVYGDLSKEKYVRQLIKQVNDLNIGVDILYNNAAIMCAWKPIGSFTEKEWLDSFQVNLLAVIALCNEFAPAMRQRGFGRIINLVSGISNTPNLAPYGVSKAAVRMYTQELAFDLAGSNVLANNLDPGWLKTDMGGENAMYPVEDVLPGALVPALLDDNGASGQTFKAQDYRDSA
jgi:NAD(P)-dependent dehydrogenase (short-subunit alcohol dehydrogenase family)